MNTNDLKQRHIEEIGAEFGQPIEEFGEHPEEDDLDLVKKRRLQELEPGTPEAEALESVTWGDIRASIY